MDESGTAPPEPRDPISGHLREHTRELHDRVEKVVDLPALCGHPESYVSLLSRLLGLYVPLEAAQAGLNWPEVGLDFEARRKAHLLRSDLAALGVSAAAIDALPLCPGLSRPATLAGGLGRQYVFEGATLGGKIIAQQLQRSLGITPGAGGAFYTAYGERTGIMWREFCSAANLYCGDDPQKRADALAGAMEAFEVFEEWLRGVGARGERWP